MTTWSKTPPSEAGWYWRKTRSSPSEQPMWSSGDGNKYPGDEFGPRIPSPEDIEAAKDALREASHLLAHASSGAGEYHEAAKRCRAAIAKLDCCGPEDRAAPRASGAGEGRS